MEALLYLADDIQTLADQKLLLVGLYSDRTIIFHRELNEDERKDPAGVPPPAVAQLCVLLTLLDFPPGAYDTSVTFVDPEGKEFAKPLGPFTVLSEPEAGTNLVLKVTPFVARMPGKYTVKAVLGDTAIERTFEVRIKYTPEPVPKHGSAATSSRARE